MAKYSTENFERISDGLMQLVAWQSTKHVHDTGLITAIEKWLPTQVLGEGEWEVRKNSYRPNVGNSPPDRALVYR